MDDPSINSKNSDKKQSVLGEIFWFEIFIAESEKTCQYRSINKYNSEFLKTKINSKLIGEYSEDTHFCEDKKKHEFYPFKNLLNKKKSILWGELNIFIKILRKELEVSKRYIHCFFSRELRTKRIEEICFCESRLFPDDFYICYLAFGSNGKNFIWF